MLMLLQLGSFVLITSMQAASTRLHLQHVCMFPSFFCLNLLSIWVICFKGLGNIRVRMGGVLWGGKRAQEDPAATVTAPLLALHLPSYQITLLEGAAALTDCCFLCDAAPESRRQLGLTLLLLLLLLLRVTRLQAKFVWWNRRNFISSVLLAWRQQHNFFLCQSSKTASLPMQCLISE